MLQFPDSHTHTHTHLAPDESVARPPPHTHPHTLTDVCHAPDTHIWDVKTLPLLSVWCSALSRAVYLVRNIDAVFHQRGSTCVVFQEQISYSCCGKCAFWSCCRSKVVSFISGMQRARDLKHGQRRQEFTLSRESVLNACVNPLQPDA